MTPNGKVALVTGGAMGIGAAIAERFLEAGACVAIFDVNGKAVRDCAARLGAKGTVLALEGDVADEAAVQSAVEQTVGRFQTLDILVSNAGVDFSGSVPETRSEDWDRVLAINLRGAYHCCKHAIPKMRRGGAILINSSVRAFVSYPGGAAYDASKAALVAFTRALALDHGKEGIRVNAICPGYVDTPMTEEWLRTVPDREETLRQVRAIHPVGRMGTPRDIAEAALFLASDAAAFITGASLVVDGGMSCAGH